MRTGSGQVWRPRVSTRSLLVSLGLRDQATFNKESVMIGQGQNTQRIQRWMTAVVCGPSTPAGGLRLTLHHAPIDEGQRLLRTWEIETIPEREVLHDLVEEVDGEAAEDAKQLSWGMQRYVLRATTADGRELGSLALRYSATTPTSGEQGAFLDSEPASARGQVALAMRHTDGAYRLLSDGYEQILDALNRRLGQQDQLLDKAMNMQNRIYDTMVDLADKRFEREVFSETKKKELEIELHREVAQLDRNQMLAKLAMERVAPLVPALLNRFLGQGTVPTATTPHEEMLASILETLTDQQLAALQTVLDPSQMANLAMLIQDLQAARGSGKPGAAGPETPAQTGRPSQETAYLALEHIKKELLPWAMERLRAGQPLALPITLAKPTKIFHLFVGALSRQQYDELVNGDVAFNPAEKEAFVKLAETFNLVPPPSKDAPAKAQTGPGTGPVLPRK